LSGPPPTSRARQTRARSPEISGILNGSGPVRGGAQVAVRCARRARELGAPDWIELCCRRKKRKHASPKLESTVVSTRRLVNGVACSQAETTRRSQGGGSSSNEWVALAYSASTLLQTTRSDASSAFPEQMATRERAMVRGHSLSEPAAINKTSRPAIGWSITDNVRAVCEQCVSSLLLV